MRRGDKGEGKEGQIDKEEGGKKTRKKGKKKKKKEKQTEDSSAFPRVKKAFI